PLLVAKDNRAALSRWLGALRGAGDFCGLQSHLFSAIHARLFGNATQVWGLSRGVSSAQRDVLRRRLDSRRWLPDSICLSSLVHPLRACGRSESVGREGPGMGDTI